MKGAMGQQQKVACMLVTVDHSGLALLEVWITTSWLSGYLRTCNVSRDTGLCDGSGAGGQGYGSISSLGSRNTPSHFWSTQAVRPAILEPNGQGLNTGSPNLILGQLSSRAPVRAL